MSDASGVCSRGFLAAAVRISTPLLLAATGEMLNERAGVINLGRRGRDAGRRARRGGGRGGGRPWAGRLAGGGWPAWLVAGAVRRGGDRCPGRPDHHRYGGDARLGGPDRDHIPDGLRGGRGRGSRSRPSPRCRFPGLPAIAGRRRGALFTQPVLTYVAWLLVPLAWWFLFRSWWGLALRATGESAEAARAVGVPVRRGAGRCATLAGGALAGLAGATLVLAQVGTFAEKMTAGRGFIAIAIVVLGRWHPVGVLLAALLFGAANALQFAFQAMGLSVPYQLFLVMPYALALLALAGGVGRARAPAGLGK